MLYIQLQPLRRKSETTLESGFPQQSQIYPLGHLDDFLFKVCKPTCHCIFGARARARAIGGIRR